MLQAQVEDLKSTTSQLRDENMVLRAQTNTSLGQATDGSTLGHKAWAEARQLKTESECKDSLTYKLVSTPELLLGDGCVSRHMVGPSCRPL